MKKLIATAVLSTLTVGSFLFAAPTKMNATTLNAENIDALTSTTTVPIRPELDTDLTQSAEEMEVAGVVEVCDYYVDRYGNVLEVCDYYVY